MPYFNYYIYFSNLFFHFYDRLSFSGYNINIMIYNKIHASNYFFEKKLISFSKSFFKERTVVSIRTFAHYVLYCHKFTDVKLTPPVHVLNWKF